MKIKVFSTQIEQRDCGVACLLNIVRYYGGNTTIENLRRLSGTTVTGTTLLGLKQAAEKTGFEAEGYEADIPALIEHGKPVILHVLVEGNLQHYVVFYGQHPKNGTFIIGDPGKGLIQLSGEELEKIWKSKACLTLAPTESFVKKEVETRRKRRWIIELIRDDFSILAVAAVLGVIIAGLGLSMAIFSQKLIDVIIPQKNILKLNLGISLLLLLLLAKEGISYLRQYLLIYQAKEFNTRVIDHFYTRLLHLPKLFFDTRKIGELTARLNDTARIQRVISQLAGNMVADCLVVLASLVMLFVYKWQVATSCLFFLPLFFLLIRYHNKSILNAQRNVMAGYALCESNYISTMQGIETIKNFNKQELFGAANKELYKHFQSKVITLGRIQIKLSFLANISGVIFIVGVLLYCAMLMLKGQLLAGGLIAITSISGSLLPTVANLALISIPINEAKIAFDRMFEFTGVEPESENESKTEDSITFEHLQVQNFAFRFAGRSRLLNDISFEITKGEIIAIMGENGCGKSTLVQLLQKHYKPEEGNMILNHNHSLQTETSNFQWRNMIGVAPQQIHIFNGTVLENISFDQVAQPQEVINFIREQGFTPFVDSLPQSFMTLVGEEGINLSGGQKQMIALARALFHKPQLLILDEVTSAMDRQSEQFVIQLLKKLKADMGIIFITHRLHVLKGLCDRIYIMQNGKITEQGTHETLLQSENLYSWHWKDLTA